jgi:hypothetical protein
MNINNNNVTNNLNGLASPGEVESLPTPGEAVETWLLSLSVIVFLSYLFAYMTCLIKEYILLLLMLYTFCLL